MNILNSIKYIVLIISVSVFVSTTTYADSAGRYWAKQENSKQDVMQLWKKGAPLGEIGDAVYQTLKYEVYLVGVDPAYIKDSRMVSNLIEDPKVGVKNSQDLYRLAYWITLHEVEHKLGYMPSPQRLFETNRFEIWEK